MWFIHYYRAMPAFTVLQPAFPINCFFLSSSQMSSKYSNLTSLLADYYIFFTNEWSKSKRHIYKMILLVFGWCYFLNPFCSFLTYCITIFHKRAAANMCPSPLLSPVYHYVVCACLCVLHWCCQRVSYWSHVWFQSLRPQSQFGTQGGYWHHRTLTRRQPAAPCSVLSYGTDSERGHKLENSRKLAA